MEKKVSLNKYKAFLVVFFVFASATSLGYLPLVAVKTLNVELIKPREPNPYCKGRYVYVQNPPPRFSEDLLKNCNETHTSWTDTNLCGQLINGGIGPTIEGSRVLANGSWFLTNPYALSVVFHNRMRKYKCLTNDSLLASAVYVPYYAGLDASRNLWSKNVTLKDETAVEFLRWLTGTKEWGRMNGMDHFIVTGRTGWDFRRQPESKSAWGTMLRRLPASNNMSMLSVESTLWRNDYAIPYPTCFHPSSDGHVWEWQERTRRQERTIFFSFVGAPRSDNPLTLRSKVIAECKNSQGLCKHLRCQGGKNASMTCDNPERVMSFLMKSVFCLQPRGDSFTRRSFFDSILAGCIPVLFHSGSAYSQYSWFLPKDHRKYSVYIPMEAEDQWEEGVVRRTLKAIPEETIKAMREEVISLIPKVVYADPRSSLRTIEDAFDFSVKGILRRIHRVRDRIKAGKNPALGFAEMDDKKFHLIRYS